MSEPTNEPTNEPTKLWALFAAKRAKKPEFKDWKAYGLDGASTPKKQDVGFLVSTDESNVDNLYGQCSLSLKRGT
jgi:hypothetical protein